MKTHLWGAQHVSLWHHRFFFTFPFQASFTCIHTPLSELTAGREPFRGYWLWKENSGQIWEGSLRVSPVGLSVSMLLSTQLITWSSGLFFSGPTAHCHTFWWRDTDLHHRVLCQAGADSWYARWRRDTLFAGFSSFCWEIVFKSWRNVETENKRYCKQKCPRN